MGNGNNHYPGCGCGWCTGGGFYYNDDNRVSTYSNLSYWNYDRSSYTGYLSFLSKQREQTIILNVECKYCGNEIFIYSDENGGVAIFDSLGWPWPKHDCPNAPNHVKLKGQQTLYNFSDYFNPITISELSEYSIDSKKVRVRKKNAGGKTDIGNALIVYCARKGMQFIMVTTGCSNCNSMIRIICNNGKIFVVNGEYKENFRIHKCKNYSKSIVHPDDIEYIFIESHSDKKIIASVESFEGFIVRSLDGSNEVSFKGKTIVIDSGYNFPKYTYIRYHISDGNSVIYYILPKMPMLTLLPEKYYKEAKIPIIPWNVQIV